jgi:putative flippase GtrA
MPDELIEGARYILMTFLSAAISLGLPLILHETLLVAPSVAVGAGLITAFLVNFLTVKYYVFQSKDPASQQVFRYVWVSLAFRSGEFLAFLTLHEFLFIQYQVALGCVLVVSIVLKFTVYKRFVFARPHLLERTLL